MACGIPSIVFPVSGTEELITNENGIRCTDFTVESLCSGITKAMNTTYNAQKIREDMITRFSPSKIAEDYLTLYRKAYISNKLSQFEKSKALNNLIKHVNIQFNLFLCHYRNTVFH